MHRSILAASILFLVATGARADDPFAKLLSRLGKDPWCFVSEDFPSPVTTVCSAIKNGASAAKAEQKIAAELHVTAATAQAIGFALLVKEALEEADDRVTAADRALAEQLLARAERVEPNVLPVLIAEAQLAGGDRDRRKAYLAILPKLRKLPDRKAAALTMMSAVLDEDGAAVFLGDALAESPDEVEVINAIGGYDSRPLIRSTYGPIRFTAAGAKLRRGQERLPATKLATQAELQLYGLASLGLPERMMQLLDALPQPARQALLAGIEAPENPTIDPRLDLAAAALLAGRKDFAQELISAVPSKDENNRIKKVLAAAWSEPGADIFDSIVAWNSGMGHSTIECAFFADLTERHGYPRVAASMLRALAAPDGEWARKLQPEYLGAITTLQSDQNSMKQAWRSRAELLAPEPSSTAMPAGTVRRLIDRPRIIPFTEHPLPAAAVASTATVIDCSDAARVAATTHLPSGAHPIRMERQGNDVVAVVISSAVDPMGEVGLGGYWVLRSTDGGQSWAEYYTGLRQNMPYVVPGSSHLPMFAGDHLLIEVEVQELDTKSITFPPVAMRLSRSQKGLYLDFPWSELTRDSDGDGLTDLLEERIVTDPNNPDTDGDGIVDGRDALPQVAFNGTSTIEAEILAETIKDFSLGGGRFVVGVGDSGAESESACSIRTSVVGEPVQFYVSDRLRFAPLQSSRRASILTAEEMEAYSKKFGPTYGASVSEIIIDRTQTRAIIDLDQSWAGETYLLEKTKKGWEKTQLTGWIS